jgi:hypothetical protein
MAFYIMGGIFRLGPQLKCSKVFVQYAFTGQSMSDQAHNLDVLGHLFNMLLLGVRPGPQLRCSKLFVQ